jgi:hypothetical protein
MPAHLRSIKLLLAAGALLVFSAANAQAAADPNGTWKWTFTGQGGQEIQLAVTLKQDGEKLTGNVTRGDQTTEISDGTFKNDEVKFNVVRERDGNKFVAKYQGKVEADSLKGTIEFEFGGETRSFEWNATRDKK